jgi:hypothetical protein
MENKILASKKFPECATEALKLIRLNQSRLNRTEMHHLVYDYVFYCDLNKDTKTWQKKATTTAQMHELQSIDAIVNFFESQPESSSQPTDNNNSDFIFDVLFGDFYNQSLIAKSFIQLLISYSISLEAKCTLECVSKWCIQNIGNEIVQNLFDQILRDHFLLSSSKAASNHLINLCVNSPLFASLFMAIVLDMIANNLITDQEKLLSKILNVFEQWMSMNPALPIMALKLNFSHASSYMLNPINGLVYLTLVYPIKIFTDSNYEQNSKANQLISKVHFITMKLIKDLKSFLNNHDKSNEFQQQQQQQFQLINLKSLEAIMKKLSDYDSTTMHNISNQNNNNNILDNYLNIRNQTLDHMAQFLELCWQFNFIQFSKQDVQVLYEKYLKKMNHLIKKSQKNNEEEDFIELLLA